MVMTCFLLDSLLDFVFANMATQTFAFDLKPLVTKDFESRSLLHFIVSTTTSTLAFDLRSSWCDGFYFCLKPLHSWEIELNSI